MSDEAALDSSLSAHLSSLGAQRRVAVTGVGIVSPFGRGRDAALDALRNARSGIRTIASIDPAPLNCRIAGEVPGELTEHCGHDRFTRFALLAAEEAAAQAGDLGIAPERVGVLIGTGLGGCETLDTTPWEAGMVSPCKAADMGRACSRG